MEDPPRQGPVAFGDGRNRLGGGPAFQHPDVCAVRVGRSRRMRTFWRESLIRHGSGVDPFGFSVSDGEDGWICVSSALNCPRRSLMTSLTISASVSCTPLPEAAAAPNTGAAWRLSNPPISSTVQDVGQVCLLA